MRIFARFFIPFFTLWLVMFPATVYAVPNTFRIGSTFYPKSAAGYGLVAVDALALIGSASPWVGAVVTGYQVGKLVLNAMDASGNPAGTVNILPSGVAQSFPSNAISSGWSLDANGNAYPPLNATYTPFYSTSTLNPPGAICTAPLNTIYTNGSIYFEVAMSQPAGGIYYGTCSDYLGQTGVTATVYTVPFTACPAGYTVSGSTCNLSNTIAVMFPSDGAPSYQVKADGSGFQLDSRDPDTVNAPVTSSPLIVKGADSSGSPVQITVTPITGGGMSIETFKQTLNSDGSTTTFRQKVTMGSDGKVTDTQSGNYPGSIAQQSGNPVQQPTSTTTTTIQFPTDYNREATQQGIKSDLDVIKTDLDPTQIPTDLDATNMRAMTDAKTARDGLVTDIGAIPTAGSPAPAATLLQPFTPSVCTPMSYTFGSSMTAGNHTVTLDLCPWVPMIQRIGSWAMYLITAAMLFQMFTRRPEGGAD